MVGAPLAPFIDCIVKYLLILIILFILFILLIKH